MVTVYRIDKRTIRYIPYGSEDVVPYQDFDMCWGIYMDLNTAKRTILSEIQRLHKDCTSVLEIENTNRREYSSVKRGWSSPDISVARFIYKTDTATDGEFIFTITEVEIHDEVSAPYNGRKMKLIQEKI